MNIDSFGGFIFYQTVKCLSDLYPEFTSSILRSLSFSSRSLRRTYCILLSLVDPQKKKMSCPELPTFFRTSRTGNASVTPSPYGPSNAGDSSSRFESAQTFAIAPVPVG
jgi:hypothetical protein